MGRKVQTTRKKRHFGSQEEVRNWSETKSDPRWRSVSRVVYAVDATGDVKQKYGHVDCISGFTLPLAQIESVVSDDLAAQLDAWIKSAREEVEFTHPSGVVDTKVELEPCPVAVPGWRRVTKAEETAKRLEFAHMMAFVLSRALQ